MAGHDPKFEVNLAAFDNAGYSPGAGPLKRLLWYVTNAVLFDSWLLPVYSVKSAILRWFGARVGQGLVIKPRVNIKYPWRLRVGDHVWIGEGAWIDNLGDVEIGDNACLSQGALLLTGNHDYRDPRFRLIVQGITLERGVWVGARSTVCPGVRMATNSILVVGSTLRSDTDAGGIYSGNPAVLIRQR
jgi:putative colanic acid biosynthesis acetyltransferase WcaF